ncbi:damage-inducible protein DinB [Muricauda sp. 2012CJ35-5]|uniref:Damage-inducible protein DinB n=1 Tax=Flagellimonas spongiicola TaxID=2942208 RepID=A0ABT0PSS8_9FLAO|nr:DinB family protein [Allomuricauda spongiicola]MCL6274442.1 damage-inducible protein DinB [Allomuricauda spongiicola]
MKGFLHQLFDYNFYCNKKLIAQCDALEEFPEHSTKLFSHILNAHHIWNQRILGKPSEYQVWQIHQKDKWGDIHYENQRATFEIITNADDFTKRIDYENSEGRTYANDLKDILFHIVNHSTHHRGQILTDFRTNGIEPEALDYIFYKR